MRNEVEWKIARATNGGRSSATPEFKTIRHLRDTGLAELREIARGLHPGALTNHGLLRALEALGERLPVVAGPS